MYKTDRINKILKIGTSYPTFLVHGSKLQRGGLGLLSPISSKVRSSPSCSSQASSVARLAEDVGRLVGIDLQIKQDFALFIIDRAVDVFVMRKAQHAPIGIGK